MVLKRKSRCRKVQAPGVQYGNCSTCNGTGQVTKIANTILGRMQTSSICQTVQEVVKLF